MLTDINIQLFYDEALCVLGCEFAEQTTAASKGKRMDLKKISKLKLIALMLKSINGFDPYDDTNCNTNEEILNIIEYVAVELGICLSDLTPPLSYNPIDGIDYMNIEFGDNVMEIQ